MNPASEETNLIVVEKNFALQRIYDGFTIYIDENVLTSGYKFCHYTSWDGESSVAKQILSDIMVNGVGSLKAELREIKEERYEPYVQILVRPNVIHRNPLKKLLTEFPNAYYFLRVRYFPHGTYGDYSESSVMDFNGEWKDPVCEFSVPFHEPRKHKFATWKGFGIINFKLECRVPNAAIYPSEYLKELESEAGAAFPGFREMLELGTLSDAVLVAKNGAEIRCHRAILAGCSPVLRAMFQRGMVESRTGRVNMSNNSDEGLWAFLRLLYYGDKDVLKADAGILLEVLSIVHMYDIPRLQAQVMQCMLEKEDREFSVQVAFDMYMFVRNIRPAFLLKMKIARFLDSNWFEVNALPEYEALCMNHREIAEALHDDVDRSTLN